MVGFVIVSHSETLANGVVELTKMMADGVPIRCRRRSGRRRLRHEL
ncbi:MAG: hypothetical protein ACLRSV_08745 [Oscillospiraceae bacterium]